jgi:hypothetical protein
MPKEAPKPSVRSFTRQFGAGNACTSAKERALCRSKTLVLFSWEAAFSFSEKLVFHSDTSCP